MTSSLPPLPGYIRSNRAVFSPYPSHQQPGPATGPTRAERTCCAQIRLSGAKRVEACRRSWQSGVKDAHDFRRASLAIAELVSFRCRGPSAEFDTKPEPEQRTNVELVKAYAQSCVRNVCCQSILDWLS